MTTERFKMLHSINLYFSGEKLPDREFSATKSRERSDKAGRCRRENDPYIVATEFASFPHP